MTNRHDLAVRLINRPGALADFGELLGRADISIEGGGGFVVGDAHAIGRLARHAGITPATASSHLRKLDDAGLVTVTTVGRERHVRLAGAEVAEALERLAALAQRTAPPSRAAALRFARTCYD